MEGLTKKRFTVWMVLFVLLILLAGGGIGSHFMGYGKSGEVRKEVSPIIDRYNKLTAVVALNASEETKMKANLTSDGIQVTYVGKNGPSKTKFVYKTDGNLKYLEASYNRSEADAENIVKYMIDAVSVHNGNTENKVFERHNLNDFYSTTLVQGVRLSVNGSSITAKINIGTNILANLKDNPEDVPGEIKQLVILYDDSSDFKDYVNFTVPTGFQDQGNNVYEISSGSNTCVASFKVVSESTASSADALVQMISNNKNIEAQSENINGIEWRKLTFVHQQGGEQTDYVIGLKDKVLLVEYEEYFDTKECKEYLPTITKSLTEK